MPPTARDAFQARWAQDEHALSFAMSRLDRYQSAGFDTPQFHADLNSGDESQFFQQLWEMVLGCHLLDLGLSVSAPERNAPDFLIAHEGLRIWVEAVCPTPTGIPEEVLRPPSGGTQVIEWPSKEILLRWTAAIREKRRKLELYRTQGVVGPLDRYVIAVNGCQLGASVWAEGISGWPWAAEAALAVGPIQVTINRETGQWGAYHNSGRFNVPNANNADVPTDTFWSDSFIPVSAVLGTVKASWDCAPAPICVVHNPRTDVPVPRWMFGEELDVTGTIEGDELTATRTERPDGI